MFDVQIFGKKLETSNRYVFTPFFPTSIKKGFATLIAKNINRKNTGQLYILCPVFPKYNDFFKRNLPQDSDGFFMVGVSGTIKSGETPLHASLREIAEEIGCLVINENDTTELTTTEETERKRTVHTYAIKIEKCTHLPKFLEKSILNPDKDGKNKIGCFVYGEKTDVFSFLSEKIIICKSPDKIIGVAAIKIDDILKHYFNINFEEIRKRVEKECQNND